MPQPRIGGVFEHWQSAQNRLGFAFRNFLKGYGLPYEETAEPKTGLFQGKVEQAQAFERLNAIYDLQVLAEKTSVSRYLENLTYLDWLDCFYRSAPESFQTALEQLPLSWLDVGAKNWSYLGALTAFLQRHQPEFELQGLELDPNRRYTDFRTRKQYAETYIAGLPEAQRSKTHYHAGDILEWRQPVQIISHFLPFVFPEPHLAWGLPLSLFNPQAVLQQELKVLKPQGLLLIVNQGETEAKAQQALLEEAAKNHAIRYQSLGQLPVRFVEYQYPRYGWICIKQSD